MLIKILYRFSLAQAQEVLIQDLRDNPGILPVKLGQAKIQTSTHDFIHFLDLQPIAQEIILLESQYEDVTKAIQEGLSYPYFYYLQNFDRSLKYLIKTAKEKLHGIYPTSKIKRGIFNGLGTVIKTISGNLDQEDAEKYNDAITSLQRNQKNVISRMNIYLSLNQKVLRRFNETLNLINHNEELIKEETLKISKELNKVVFDFNHFLQTRNVLDQLQLSLQIIIQTLTDLETSITFARIHTIHSNLLKQDELEWIIQKMLEHHPENQIPYTNPEDFPKYFNLISLDGFYSNNSIIFVLHFPILHTYVFNYFHLFSVPTINRTTIIPPAPYLATDDIVYQYMDLPCKKSGSISICPETFIQERSNQVDCMTDILQSDRTEASCHIVPVTLDESFIQEVSEAHYIAVLPEPTKIATRCHSTKILVLQGVFLIELPPECEFRTPEEAFINSKTTIPEEPLTLPKVQTKKIDQQRNVKPIKLSKLPLDELQQLTKEEDRLQPLPLEEHTRDTTHFWMTPIYIILTAAIAVGSHRLYIWIKKKENRANSEPADGVQEAKVLFVPHKTSSGDGVVTVY